jgi:hypothetical protein
MSTRPDDELVNLLSQWLARHVDDDELRAGLTAVEGRDRGKLEMVVRETLESLALG